MFLIPFLKENLELLGQRLYRMSIDLNIKKFKKES